MDNSALADGLMAGDRAAALEFVDRFAPRVNRLVWRLLGADMDHDEVVQQVFAAFLSSLRSLRDTEALDAFLDSVTIRTVRKEIRRRRFRRRLFGSLDRSSIEDTLDRSSPMKQAHIRSFYAILDDLAADDRVVFVLRHLEGLTVEAIAERGGHSLSTAKRRLKRATREFKRRALKDPVLLSMLEEYGNEN